MSSLLSLVVVPLFSFVPVQDPAAPAPAKEAAPAASDEAKAALARAIESLAGAGSYAFELKTEGSGGGFGGRRNRGGEGEGGEPPSPPPPAKVKYEKGLPMHLSRGEMQAFVQGDVIVYLDAEKQSWEKFDPASMRGGRGGRGPGGGDAGAGASGAAGGESGGAPPTPPEAPPAPPTGGDAAPPPQAGGDAGGAATAAGEGGDRRGGGRSGFGRMRDLLAIVRAQPPHMVLGDVATAVSEVARSDADGKVVLKGALSKEAADKIVTAGFGGGRGGFGGDGPERESSGSFEATLDAEGRLVSLVVDTKVKMSFGDREFERTSKHTYTIADVGAVSVDVPEEALVHFEF